MNRCKHSAVIVALLSLLLLLLLPIRIGAHAVHQSEAELAYDWHCTPDDTIQLDVEYLWRLQAVPSYSPAVQTEDERLFAFLGIPRFPSLLPNGELERDCLFRYAGFMERHNGFCPPYVAAVGSRPLNHTSAPNVRRIEYWQFYYYAFDRDGLERHFGSSRLHFLKRLRLPREWDTVVRAREWGNRTSSYDLEVMQAERRVARMGVSSPPGIVRFTLGSRRIPTEWMLSFADIKIELRAEAVDESDTATPSSRTTLFPFMILDVNGYARRQSILESIRSKRGYAANVASADARVSTARETRTRSALLNLIREEAENMLFEVGQEAHWKLYQESKKRKQQAAAEASLGGSEIASHPAVVAGASARQSAACDHIAMAFKTLQKTYARGDRRSGTLTHDSRYHALHKLARVRGCDAQVHALNSAAVADALVEDSRAAGAAASAPAYCHVVCGAVAQLRAWSRATTEPPTVAQNMALLTAAFLYHTAAPDDNFSRDADMLDAALSLTDEFDAAAFIQFATTTFHLSQCVASAGVSNTCVVPRRVEAEMAYTQSMLALLQKPQPTAHHDVTWSQPYSPFAPVARLQEAAWHGSMRATVTLATMKEHGMWLRQQRKVASALVMRSLFNVPNHLHVALLKARIGATPSPLLTPQQLLRFERVFAVANSWTAVDNPFVTKETVKLMVAVEDVTSNDDGEGPLIDNPYDETEGVHGRITTRISSMLLRALFHLTGFKGVRRSTEAAECKALAALRLLGYTCDIDLRRTMHRPLRPNSDMCEEYTAASVALWANPRYPRVRCSLLHTGGEVTSTHNTTESSFNTSREDIFSRLNTKPNSLRTMVVPRHAVHFEHLQSTLLFLSYFYLVHEQQYDLSAAYAHLAVRAAANLHHSVAAKLSSVDRQKAVNAYFHAQAGGVVRMKSQSKFSWAEKRFVTGAVLQENSIDEADNSTPVLRLPDMAHSPFLSYDHWTLLGLVAAPPRRARGTEPEAQRAIPARLLQSTLSTVFGVQNAPDAVATNETQLLTSLCLFLKGATLFKADEKATNVLDHTIYAVHRTDPFVLAVTLIDEAKDAKTFRGEADEAPRRTVTSALSAHVNHLGLHTFMGDANYLPDASEADESYMFRLLNVARTKIRHTELAITLFAKGMGSRASWDPIALLNDAPPHPHHLNGLRISKKYSTDASEFIPLLYASDLKHYMDKTSRPHYQRLIDSLVNGIFYLFTETTEESLARNMGVSVLDDSGSATAPRSDNASRNESESSSSSLRRRSSAPFVSCFQDSFLLFENLRQLTVALLLFASAMEQGLPQGFAILLYEASHAANPFLRPLAHYLTLDVWPPSTVQAMFTEHQASGQWQNEAPSLVTKRTTVLSLDRHSPFAYARAEDRQELMMRLTTWYTSRHLLPRLEDQQTPPAARRQLLSDLTAALAMCASPLLHELLVESQHNLSATLAAPHILQLYNGMQFPAGEPECLIALGEVARAHHNIRNMTALVLLLRDLGDRRAAHYGLSPQSAAPADALPPSSVELGNDIDAARMGLARSAAEDDDRSKPAKLVEPWNLIDDNSMRRSIDDGEGFFYNQRLHDVSGTRATAKLLLWKERVRSWVPFVGR